MDVFCNGIDTSPSRIGSIQYLCMLSDKCACMVFGWFNFQTLPPISEKLSMRPAKPCHCPNIFKHFNS